MPTEAPPAPPASITMNPGGAPPPDDSRGGSESIPDAGRVSSFKAAIARKDSEKSRAAPEKPSEKAPVKAEERPGLGEDDPNVPRGTKPAEASEKASDAAPAPPKEDKPTGKVNPWKLRDAEKARADKAERELTELRQRITPDQDRNVLTERVTKAEARAKALEDEIRYVNYEKSTEFQEGFEKPFVNAWNRAVAEVSEISVTDPVSGQPRAATGEDIWALVNMPLNQALPAAKELFGDFYQTAMDARKEVRTLFDKRKEALEVGKKLSPVRDQQRQEQFQQQQKKTVEAVTTTFNKVQAALLADPENSPYFTVKVPKEGETLTADETKHNELVQKWEKNVAEAWNLNPINPKLTPEQREQAVSLHAALRARAIGYGPLKLANKSLRAENAKLKKSLEQYEGSTPGAAGSIPQSRASSGVLPGSREEMKSVFLEKKRQREARGG